MPPQQKLINYIGLSKQSAKGTPATSPATFGFGTLSGKVFDVPLDQTYEDQTLGGAASDRFSPSVNRVGALPAVGVSDAVWADSANTNGWSVPLAVLLPEPAPLANVTAAWVTTGTTGSFSMSISGGIAVVVDANIAPASATLVYQVDRQANGIITISPQDLTTSTGLNNVARKIARRNRF